MKKFLSILLSTVMLLTVVTSCSGGDQAKVTQDSGKNSMEGSKAGSSEAAASTQADASPVQLTVMGKDMPADDPITLDLLDRIGEAVSKQLGREVRLSMVPLQDGTYSETMGLKLQSGEIPDLMYFQGGDQQFAITQEILQDLTTYVDQSTYVKSLIQPFNKERLANYPYLLWLAVDRISVPVVRKDWFDACKTSQALLDDPTIENYVAFMKELVSNNSLKSATTVPNDLSELDSVFAQAFGITSTWMKAEDGSFAYSKVTAMEKAKLSFYAELYKEKLLDNTYLTQKWDTKEKAFYDGDVGLVFAKQGAVVRVYNDKMIGQNGEGTALVVLPPAQGEAQGYSPSDVSKESRGWAIYNDSPNKDVAFAVLEYMASPEGQLLDKLGREGEEYIIENNEIVLQEAAAAWFPRFHESIYDFTPTPPLSSQTPYFPEAAIQSLQLVEKFSSNDNSFVMPDELVPVWDACQMAYNEFAASVITGKAGIETFDDFVKEWTALGGDQITEYANSKLK